MTGLHRPFLEWVETWENELPALALADVVTHPKRTALLSVDMVRGFCCEGPLASPRVAGVVPAVAALFQRAYDLGVRDFLLSQDTHQPGAPEFGAFPPHAVAGSSESETVDELRGLPFADQLVIMEKNSLSTSIGTGFEDWLKAHPEVSTFIVVGDCTDLCVYQAAMFLQLRANALGIEGVRVVVPADCVQTYDLHVDTAWQLGAMPHDGDLLQRLFLYHMALNGIEIVAGLT